MSIAPVQRPFRILFAPRAVFESIRDGVRWEWLVALALLAVIGVSVGSVLVPKVDFAEFLETQMESRDINLSESDMQEQVALQSKVMGVWIRFVQPLVVGPLIYLLVSLVFWVLLKLVGGEAPYSAVFTVFVHSFMPFALASLLWLPVLFSRQSIEMEAVQTGGILASNLGWLAPAGTSLAVKTLLASFDVFSLWTAWLLSLGLSVVGRVSMKASGILVGGLWTAWIIVKVGLAAIGS